MSWNWYQMTESIGVEETHTNSFEEGSYDDDWSYGGEGNEYPAYVSSPVKDGSQSMEMSSTDGGSTSNSATYNQTFDNVREIRVWIYIADYQTNQGARIRFSSQDNSGRIYFRPDGYSDRPYIRFRNPEGDQDSQNSLSLTTGSWNELVAKLNEDGSGTLEYDGYSFSVPSCGTDWMAMEPYLFNNVWNSGSGRSTYYLDNMRIDYEE